jgi:hypothetical protein
MMAIEQKFELIVVKIRVGPHQVIEGRDIAEKD